METVILHPKKIKSSFLALLKAVVSGYEHCLRNKSL